MEKNTTSKDIDFNSFPEGKRYSILRYRSHDLDPNFPLKYLYHDEELHNAPYHVIIDQGKLSRFIQHLGIEDETARKTGLDILRRNNRPRKRGIFSNTNLVSGTFSPSNDVVTVFTSPLYSRYQRNLEIATQIAQLPDTAIGQAKSIVLKGKLHYSSSSRLVRYLRVVPPERGIKMAKELFYKQMQRQFNEVLTHEFLHVKQKEEGVLFDRSKTIINNSLQVHMTKIAGATVGAITAGFTYNEGSSPVTIAILSAAAFGNGYLLGECAKSIIEDQAYRNDPDEIDVRGRFAMIQNDSEWRNVGYLIPHDIYESLQDHYARTKMIPRLSEIL